MMYCTKAEPVGIDWSELEKRREHPEKRREIVKLSQRKRRAEAVKKGLCQCCCKRTPAPDRKNCPVCLERAREAQRRKRADIH